MGEDKIKVDSTEYLVSTNDSVMVVKTLELTNTACASYYLIYDYDTTALLSKERFKALMFKRMYPHQDLSLFQIYACANTIAAYSPYSCFVKILHPNETFTFEFINADKFFVGGYLKHLKHISEDLILSSEYGSLFENIEDGRVPFFKGRQIVVPAGYTTSNADICF